MIFSANFVWKFLILRTTQLDMIINVHKYSCKVPVILVRFQWKLSFFLHIFEKKYSNITFHKYPSARNRVVLCGQTENDFPQYCGNALKNTTHAWIAKLWLIWRVMLCRIMLRISFELRFGPCFAESEVFKHLVVKRSLCS